MEPSVESLAELLEQSVRKFKDNDLFGTKQASGRWLWLSYREFHGLVARCRGGLRQLGVVRGDRVAIVAHNRWEWAASAFACYGLGAQVVPLHPSQPAADWAYTLRDSGASLVLAAAPALEAVRAISRRLTPPPRVIALDAASADSDGFEALLARGAACPAALATVKGAEVACIIYTSGTTGRPKGVVLTHANICGNVEAAGSRFDYSPRDRSLCILPWAHIYGQTSELYTLIRFGASLAINDEVANFLANLGEVRPSVLIGVPRLFNRMHERARAQLRAAPRWSRAMSELALARGRRMHQRRGLLPWQWLLRHWCDPWFLAALRHQFGGRLRFAISGSAALDPEVACFLSSLGIPLYEGYGLTEASPVATTNFPGHCRAGSVGKPLPGVGVRIDETKGSEPGSGEVIISGPNVMHGYYNLPEQTARALLPDGALRTGDLGRLEDGFLFITGRINERFKLDSGQWVVPSAIEEHLKLSPYVANVFIYGANRPHLVALVVLEARAVREVLGQAWSPAAGDEESGLRRLIAGEISRCSADLKPYERPQDFLVIHEDFTQENGLLTPSMKLRRSKIAKRYRRQLEARYEAIRPSVLG